jgi:transcription antitermination factor NusG
MEGPLRGVIGVVEATQKRKIVVSIELVGRAVSATLDADAVAPYLDK